MRYFYIALIVLLTAVVLVFKFQHLTSVTISDGRFLPPVVSIAGFTQVIP